MLERLKHTHREIRIFAFLLIPLISGCESGKLPNLTGRYQGIQSVAGNTTQIISQIPDWMTLNGSQVLRFRLHPTLSSVAGSRFQITRLNDKTLLLQATPFLPEKGVLLKIDNHCSSGKIEELLARACWDAAKIEIEIKNLIQPEKAIAIHLFRDDTLPPILEENPKNYSLDELMGRAKFINYTVSQEAERVFQAKQNISVARGNLLPKLNLKAIIGVFTGDYLSTIGTVLPFLFPNNWYQWKSSQWIYEAERNSFASLRGNEMNFVEGFFYLQLRDQYVLQRLKKHIAWMKNVQEGLRKEETVGALPTGAADYFGTSVALLERDQVGLEALVKTQYGLLSQAVALPPINGISGLVAMELPKLDKVQPIDPSEYFRDAQQKSYEIKALGFLAQAAQYLDNEVVFGFFDPDGNGGLGFGTASQLRVAKSQQNELRKKVDETYSLLELKSSTVATEYNQALESYRIASSSLAATEKRLKWVIDRHLNGDATLDEQEFVDQIVDLQFKIMGLIADQATASQVWLMAQSKLDRLLLSGFYSDLEAALPLSAEKLKEYEKYPDEIWKDL